MRAHPDHQPLVAIGSVLAPMIATRPGWPRGHMLGRVRLPHADALESPAVEAGTEERFATGRIRGAVLFRAAGVVPADVGSTRMRGP